MTTSWESFALALARFTYLDLSPSPNLRPHFSLFRSSHHTSSINSINTKKKHKHIACLPPPPIPQSHHHTQTPPPLSPLLKKNWFFLGFQKIEQSCFTPLCEVSGPHLLSPLHLHQQSRSWQEKPAPVLSATTIQWFLPSLSCWFSLVFVSFEFIFCVDLCVFMDPFTVTVLQQHT